MGGGWSTDASRKYVVYHLIPEYFFFRPHLDCNDDLKVAGEHRCVQCNAFLPDQASLRSHVRQRHTYPVRKGTVTYRKTYCEVQLFCQKQFPRVQLLGDYLMRHDKVTGHVTVSDGVLSYMINNM